MIPSEADCQVKYYQPVWLKRCLAILASVLSIIYIIHVQIFLVLLYSLCCLLISVSVFISMTSCHLEHSFWYADFI